MIYKNKFTINTNDNEYKDFKIKFNDYIETNDFIIIDKYLLAEDIGRKLCDEYENSECNWETVRTEIKLLTNNIASDIFYITEEYMINNFDGKYES